MTARPRLVPAWGWPVPALIRCRVGPRAAAQHATARGGIQCGQGQGVLQQRDCLRGAGVKGKQLKGGVVASFLCVYI
jgi:hypothetical protein